MSERPMLTDRQLEYAAAIANGIEPAPRPDVTDHAATRWRDRIDPDDRRPRYAIREAWSRSVAVGFENGSARAFPPGDALLVYDNSPIDPQIVTVLPLYHQYRKGRIRLDSLKVCRRCRQPFDPARLDSGRCPWCDKATWDATAGHQVTTAVMREFGVVPQDYDRDEPARRFVTPAAVIDVVPEPGDQDGTLRGWVRVAGETRETSIALDVVRALKGNHLVSERTIPAWRTPKWMELELRPAPTPLGRTDDGPREGNSFLSRPSARSHD